MGSVRSHFVSEIVRDNRMHRRKGTSWKREFKFSSDFIEGTCAQSSDKDSQLEGLVQFDKGSENC